MWICPCYFKDAQETEIMNAADSLIPYFPHSFFKSEYLMGSCICDCYMLLFSS